MQAQGLICRAATNYLAFAINLSGFFVVNNL